MRSNLKVPALFCAFVLISILLNTAGAGSPTGSRAPSVTVTRIHVNVTYPDGSPASGATIKVHSKDFNYEYYRAETGSTNISGMTWIYITSYNLGPGHITVYTSAKTSFVSIPVHIWPGEEGYYDIKLTPALPGVNRIHGHVLNRTSGSPTGPPTAVSAYCTDAYGLRFSVFNTTTINGEYELWVPNSTEPVLVQVSILNSTERYLAFETYLYLKPGLLDYPLEIEMFPDDPADVPVHIRFSDLYTGEPVTQTTSIRYSGYETVNDHRRIDEWIWTPPNSDGWLNATFPQGEFIFDLGIYLPPETGSIMNLELPIMVNETGNDLEVQIPVPAGFRNVELEINDSDGGGPVPYASVRFSYWNREKDTSYSISTSYIETNASGRARFGVLPGMDVDVFLERWEYESKVLRIPSGPLGSDVLLETTMERTGISVIPNGNISVFTKDQTTGAPLPTTYVYGEGRHDGIDVFFSGYSDALGYFNDSVDIGIYDLTVTSSLGSGKVHDVIVTTDANTTVDIGLDRRDFDPTPELVEFYLTNAAGTPLPMQPIGIIPEVGGSMLELVSDGSGLVRANLRPGNYYLDNLNTFSHASMPRPGWVIPPGTRISVPDADGYDDIVLYPAGSLEKISGFIRDSSTNRSIPTEKVKASSYHIFDTGGSRFIYTPSDSVMDKEKVLLFEETSGSGIDGCYRVWGRESVKLECYVEGYFPYIEIFELNTRASREHDILVTEIPKYSSWVNGTIVDQDGHPLKGTVKLHDGMQGDYTVGVNTTGTNGKFSIRTYSGELWVEYYNVSLDGRKSISVPEGGLEDLILELIPISSITGVVRSPTGDPLEGIEVVLEDASVNSTIIDTYDTIAEGSFEFQVRAGIYVLGIRDLEEYGDYESEHIIATGWNDIAVDIFLENRSEAVEVSGIVLGDGGPYADGIAGALVELRDELGTNLKADITGLDGTFRFVEVGFGENFSIIVTPSEDLRSDAIFYRSGYGPKEMSGIDISERLVDLEITLHYVEYTPPGHFEVIDHSPKGINVSIDEPIRLWFTESVNRSTLMNALTIDPFPLNLTYRFNGRSTALAIYHDRFAATTKYHVTLSSRVLSQDGDLIDHDNGSLEWDFTTGVSTGRWGLYSSVITIGYDRSWTINTTGGVGQDVNFIIEGVGSFKLVEVENDATSSKYSRSIDGSLFEWNTTYWFHYSDSESGPDMAVDMSGSRHMPKEGEGVIPPPEWKLTSADVSIAQNGDWVIVVAGNEGLDIYIVISGIGSFLLVETGPGEYVLTLNASRFEGGRQYNYHFSNTTGGEDMAPEFSGALTAMKKERGSTEEKGNIIWVLLLTLAIILILTAIAIAVVAVRKRGEEEVMDWDEE